MSATHEDITTLCLSCLFWFCWNWHNGCIQSVIVGFLCNRIDICTIDLNLLLLYQCWLLYTLSLVTNKFMLLYYTPSLLNSVNTMCIEGWLSCNLWCHRCHAMTETGSLQDCKSLDVQVWLLLQLQLSVTQTLSLLKHTRCVHVNSKNRKPTVSLVRVAIVPIEQLDFALTNFICVQNREEVHMDLR